MPWFGVVMIGVTAWTALQMLPLPVGLLRLVAPATVDLLGVSLAGAGGMGRFHPISLDPSATLLETLKIGACALALIAAHNYCYRRSRRDRLLLGLVIGGVVVTLLGFIGAVAAPGKPLMLYTPEAGAAGGLIATSFVNPNHSSAFLGLCTLVAAGLAMAARDLQRRVLLVLGAVLLGAGVFLSLSRGGILALGLGLGALALLMLLRPRADPDERRSLSSIAVPAIFGLILALSAWLAFDAIVAELRSIRPELDSHLGKIGLWPSGWAMVLANRWVGVGRGAFLTAFPRYLAGDMPRTSTYSHLENQYLHVPAELGLPVAGALILASIVSLYLWYRGSRRDAQSAALVAALLALAGHAVVDFNLETLGVALPAALLAGLLSAGHRGANGSSEGEPNGSSEASTDEPPPTSSKASRSARGRGPIRTSLALGPACALFVLVVWAAVAAPATASDDLAPLAALTAGGATSAQVLEAARGAIRRHPADPIPQLAAGRALLREGRREALAWLNRATYLFPGSPEIHLDTAAALRRFGRRHQALLEYRLALEAGASPHEVLRRALPLARDVGEASRALPGQPLAWAAAVTTLLGSGRLVLARKLVEAARVRWPNSVDVAAAEVEVLLAAKEAARAAEAAKALAQAAPIAQTLHLWARAAATAAPSSEIAILLDAHKQFPKDESFAFAIGEAYLRAKQIAKTRETAEAILGQATSPSTLASAHDLLARIHGADGRPHRAQYEAEQARKLREGR